MEKSLSLNKGDQVNYLDPSKITRPEKKFAKKALKDFRNFSINDEDPIQQRVKKTYFDMHTYQTVEFVHQKIGYWTKFDKFKASILEALEMLNNLVDESDPDVDMPNIVHAFQTAERIRQEHPHLEWFHLVGLIHDLGKVMALLGEPQWAVVGDTFPVGCRFAPSIVYSSSSFRLNPDLQNPTYQSLKGIYEYNCGLDNVLMSWGHDEYLYRVLRHNGCKLPEEGMAIIRFHSFYPWHSGGDYMHLCDDKDMKMLPWVVEFNKYDLYTKSTETPDMEALKPYYQSLIDKYVPGVLEW